MKKTLFTIILAATLLKLLSQIPLCGLILDKEFSYFWIDESSVQFWNDETKTEGVLCAFNSAKAIKEVKSWYQDVRIEKIAEGCYLVTPSQSWIG